MFPFPLHIWWLVFHCWSPTQASRGVGKEPIFLGNYHCHYLLIIVIQKCQFSNRHIL